MGKAAQGRQSGIVANSRRRLPENCSPRKKLGRVPDQEHARIRLFRYVLLELKASSQLHLPLAEQGAISTGSATVIAIR